MADLLGIGKSGLFASKKAMETTGHNIANVNTEGYSRQRVKQTTGIPITQQGLVKGTGTRILSVNRFHDEFIERRLNKELTNSEFLKQRVNHLNQIEGVFNEIDTDGLNNLLNKFFNSFRELAGQPENETMRMVIRDNARMVVRDFRRIHNTLTNIAKSIDQSFQSNVQDINAQLKSIANLNKEILRIEQLGGGETGDLRDQRDQSVRNLSKLFEVHTYMDNKNNFVVSAKGVGTLVAAGEYSELIAGPATKEKSTSGIGGSVELYYKERQIVPITHRFKGGALSSLVKIRNDDIKKLKHEIDQSAFEFANMVNAIHRRGHVSRQIPIDSQGNPASHDDRGPTSGINFFKEPIMVEDASINLSLSGDIMADMTNISTGLKANSPGDNRIALAISKIQHEKILNNGTATIEEQYLHTVAQLGMETGKARFDFEQAEGLLAQAKSVKERLVGVSLDEEAANMMRYQHAYSAAAKVMKSAETMFDTILNIKR